MSTKAKVTDNAAATAAVVTPSSNAIYAVANIMSKRVVKCDSKEVADSVLSGLVGGGFPKDCVSLQTFSSLSEYEKFEKKLSTMKVFNSRKDLSTFFERAVGKKVSNAKVKTGKTAKKLKGKAKSAAIKKLIEEELDGDAIPDLDALSGSSPSVSHTATAASARDWLLDSISKAT